MKVWGIDDRVFAVGRAAHVSNILEWHQEEWSAIKSPNRIWLHDIWGIDSENIFAVGNMGTILHYDGKIWTPMISTTTEHLWGVWGSSAQNVFAVGNNVILHYDGNKWCSSETVVANHLSGIWGNEKNVFTVGANGDILLCQKGQWSAMHSGTWNYLLGVWGSSEDNVFAVGVDVLLHYDGNEQHRWAPMNIDVDSKHLLFDIWGTNAKNIFAVGNNGIICHYDGNQNKTWRICEQGEEDFSGIWGCDRHFFAAGANIICQYEMKKNIVKKNVWGFDKCHI